MRYLRLLRLYAANSIQLELEYRANFAVSGVTALLSLAAGLAVLSVMFGHADSFGGWSFHEALTLFGIFLLFEELIYGTLTDNLSRLPELIRTGELDFVLLKPINSQFQVSARRFSLSSLPAALLGIGVAIYGMLALGTLTPANIGLAVCLVLSGVVIVYSLWIMLLTTAFWFVKVENITEIFNAFFSAGRFPVSAFPPWVRFILTFIVPIAFITTVPASAAIGRLDWAMALASFAVAGFLLLLSHRFWRFALGNYTSASS